MNQVSENIKNPAAQQPVKCFPLEGTNLARILNDSQHRQSFHAQLKRYNPLIVMLYRVGLLPLFGAGQTVMLLTTRGKKSGRLRSTPIGYFRIGGAIYLFSAWGKGTGWYRNLEANPNEVWIQIGLRKRRVTVQALQDPLEIQQVLEQFISESPSQAKNLFGWDPAIDRIENADFSIVYQRVLIVRFIEQG